MISTKSFGIITLKKSYFGEVETPYCTYARWANNIEMGHPDRLELSVIDLQTHPIHTAILQAN